MPGLKHIDNSKLTETDRAILAFISQHPQEAQSMSAKQLAEATFTSPAAIVRFCKRAGFESLPALKLELARRNEAGSDFVGDFDFPRLDQAGDAQAIHSIASIERSSIRETEKILSDMDLSPIIDAMEAATGFALYGMGYSQNATKTFYTNMTRLGHAVMRDFDSSRMASWAGTCAPTDMAFLVSYSGETESSVFHAEILKKRGVKTVSITTSDPNTLATQTTWNIPVAATERRFFNNRISPFASTAAIEFVFDVLYALFFKRHYTENLRKLTNSLVVQGAKPRYSAEGRVAGLDLDDIPLLRPPAAADAPAGSVRISYPN